MFQSCFLILTLTSMSYSILIYFLSEQAIRGHLCCFRLALRGYSVTYLDPSGFAILASLARLLRLRKFSKISVSQSIRNALKRIVMHKKKNWKKKQKTLWLITRFAKITRNFDIKVCLNWLKMLWNVNKCKQKFLPSWPGCQSQGPKEYPYQVSCRSVINCGR